MDKEKTINFESISRKEKITIITEILDDYLTPARAASKNIEENWPEWKREYAEQKRNEYRGGSVLNLTPEEKGDLKVALFDILLLSDFT
jgi:hypothetical protein